MKRKKIKFLIPVVAIALAFATSAFGTEDSEKVNKEGLMIGYVYQSQANPCDEQYVDCNIEGDYTCEYNNSPVFKDLSLNGTSCINELKRD